MIPTHIILHHSLTRDGTTVSWDAIRQYHLGGGWNDIGYHFGIELVDGHFEILFGRFSDQTGAHCKGMNERAIGICFVGDFDRAAPPHEQWDLGIKLIRWLMNVYYIPIENVQGHWEFSSKSCPGRKFNLGKFRSDL